MRGRVRVSLPVSVKVTHLYGLQRGCKGRMGLPGAARACTGLWGAGRLAVLYYYGITLCLRHARRNVSLRTTWRWSRSRCAIHEWRVEWPRELRVAAIRSRGFPVSNALSQPRGNPHFWCSGARRSDAERGDASCTRPFSLPFWHTSYRIVLVVYYSIQLCTHACSNVEVLNLLLSS